MRKSWRREDHVTETPSHTATTNLQLRLPQRPPYSKYCTVENTKQEKLWNRVPSSKPVNRPQHCKSSMTLGHNMAKATWQRLPNSKVEQQRPQCNKGSMTEATTWQKQHDRGHKTANAAWKRQNSTTQQNCTTESTTWQNCAIESTTQQNRTTESTTQQNHTTALHSREHHCTTEATTQQKQQRLPHRISCTTETTQQSVTQQRPPHNRGHTAKAIQQRPPRQSQAIMVNTSNIATFTQLFTQLLRTRVCWAEQIMSAGLSGACVLFLIYKC